MASVLENCLAMANTSDQSNLFDLLKEYDVEFSPQLKLLLTKLKYDSVRTLSMIDCDRLEDFEKDVRLVVAADDQLANMTREHKIALFGDYFADKPQQFKLLAGENVALKLQWVCVSNYCKVMKSLTRLISSLACKSLTRKRENYKKIKGYPPLTLQLTIKVHLCRYQCR